MATFSAKANFKIVSALAAVAATLALVVASSFWAFSKAEDAAQARKHTFEVLNRVDDFMSTLSDAETGQRGFLLTGDEAFLEPYVAVRDRARNQLDALRQVTAIAGARQHLDLVAPLLEARLVNLAQAIELYRAHSEAAAMALVRSGQGQRLTNNIRAEMRSFRQLEEAALAQKEVDFQSTLHQLFYTIAAAGVFALLLVFSFAWLVYRESQHRLRDLLLIETQHSLAVEEQSNRRLQQINTALQLRYQLTLCDIISYIHSLL
jgi:CHASE3 domain sensor protein